jgi:alpha-L-fucosidase
MTFEPPARAKWFLQDRFGMFIHWGLYSLGARHEWLMNREEIDPQTYHKYFEHFNPDLYDPNEWAQVARKAGMRYAVITAKHHEGFCLWDSKLTDYKATNTPYGKDLVQPWVKAFREAGLKVGFYYSLLDWHHPDFPIDFYHPLRNQPDALELNKQRDIRRYQEYLHGQVRELLTDFGKIDLIWFDFSYPDRQHRGIPGKGHKDWESEKLLELVRQLQPDILVNHRLDLPYGAADFYTPEQYQPQCWPTVEGLQVVWESCQTFSGSWGYYRDEQTWKSPAQLIEMLINDVACGGNLLMNVGPTGRGTLDRRATQALEEYRKWMSLHSRAIYNCTQSEFTPPPGCRYTQNGKRLYVHIYNWPFQEIFLPDLAGKVEYAQFLNDASEIKLEAPSHIQPVGDAQDLGNGALHLELPVQKPDVIVPVIELFLN